MGASASVLSQNSTLNDYDLKQKRLCAEFTITGNATPASKVHGIPELPGVLLLRTEGKTAEVDAIETVSYATADDESSGNSVFGIMIRGGDSYAGTIKKVLQMRLTDRGGTATSLAITAPSGTTVGLTTGGNMAFNIAGTGLRLDTENADIVVTVDYVAQK